VSLQLAPELLRSLAVSPKIKLLEIVGARHFTDSFPSVQPKALDYFVSE